MNVARTAMVLLCIALAGGAVACGARTSLGDGSGSSGIGAADGNAGSQRTPGADAASTADGGLSTCSLLPATVTRVTSFGSIGGEAFGLAVRGASLYVGIAILPVQGKPRGFIGRVPTSGMSGTGDGVLTPIAAPEYLIGELAFDDSRLYYPRGVIVTIPQGDQDSLVGLVAQDVATGNRTEIPISGTLSGFAASPAVSGVAWMESSDAPAQLATRVHRWTPTGGDELLSSGGTFSGVLADETNVYWSDTDGGVTRIFAQPWSGGAQRIVATAPWQVSRGGIAGVTNGTVLFVGDLSTGAIQAVSAAGGSPWVVITTSFENTWTDGDDVYWTDRTTQHLSRVSIHGGSPELLWTAPPEIYIENIAFDACNIYIAVVNDTEIFGRRK